MISFFVYILKLLISLFVTTILVTDINTESDKSKNKNIKFMFFASFFTLTLVSISTFISNATSFYYGATIIVIYFVVHSLSLNFNQDDKIKVYLISLCSTLFGFGTFALTLIGFVASIVSYIIMYNSTEFYKLFFSNDGVDVSESTLIDKEDDIK